ncbi:MAG: sigma-70 family RNA polymerase sigma factor [Bacteroidota bacterium]
METKTNLNTTEFSIKTESDFKELYDLFWEPVYAICVNNTGDRELSKDMTQDIFSSLWQRREKLVINGSIENYLARSAKMKVSEYFRNRETQKKHLKVIEILQQKTVQNTDETAVISLFNKQLDFLLRGFSSTTKKVFQLSHEKGLNTKQIAAALSTTERNVQYHKKKGLRKLKIALTRRVLGLLSFFLQLFSML